MHDKLADFGELTSGGHAPPACSRRTPEAPPKTAPATTLTRTTTTESRSGDTGPPINNGRTLIRTTEANRLQALRAVQSFLDRHRHVLADLATNGARRRLDAALAGLE